MKTYYANTLRVNRMTVITVITLRNFYFTLIDLKLSRVPIRIEKFKYEINLILIKKV